MSHRAAALGLAITSAVAFGTSGPLAKPLITAGVGSAQVAWLRVAGAALVLVPLAIRGRRVVRRRPGLVIGYGVLAVAGVQLAYFGAVARIPVGVALLIEYLAPVIVLLVAGLLLGRTIPRSAAVGAAVTVLGLAGVVEVWSGLAFDPLGLLLALLAAVCLASYFLLSEHGASAEPTALLAWALLVGTLVLTPLARPWTAPWSALAGPVQVGDGQVDGVVLAGGLVLIGTIAAYLTGIASVRLLSAPVAAVIATLEAVVAVVLAWVLLGEAMSPPQVAGGVIVLIGAALAHRGAGAARTVDGPVVEPVPVPPATARSD